MTYIDAAIYSTDWDAALVTIGARARVEGASFSSAMPQVTDGAGIVYVRFTPVEAETWRGTPGIEVLAETPYDPDTDTPTEAAARLEAAIRADAAALAKWASVRPLDEVTDEEAGTTHTPPFFPAIVG